MPASGPKSHWYDVIPGSIDRTRQFGCYGSGTENEYLLTAKM